jgi:hypothetical protein
MSQDKATSAQETDESTDKKAENEEQQKCEEQQVVEPKESFISKFKTRCQEKSE